MIEQINQVKDFHEKFGHPVAEKGIASGDNYKVAQLRYELIREELEEYREAIMNNDLVAIADSLSDLAYVLFGTYLAHGLHPVAVELFNEVQRSNMSKLGADGNPIVREDGKILKGENYTKPNLTPIVEKVCKNQ